MAEITGQGVITKTLDEWYQAVVAYKQAVWGDNYVIDPTTKQGADVVQLAELFYNAEQNHVSALSQLHIDTATGICLDWLGQVKGVLRNGGFPQQLKVEITSQDVGYTITPDIVFQTQDSLYSYTVATAVEITELTQEVVLIYTSDGNPDVNEGDTLSTVSYEPEILNVVIKNGGITAGTETESDAEYRARIKSSEIGFIGTLQLIYSELLQIQGLAKSNYYYNDNGETDEKGIPAYATEFLAVPDEGVDSTTFNNLVAQKICDTKEPGAPTYGNTTVQVSNYMGQDKEIKFSRPAKVKIFIKAQIGPNAEGVFSTISVPAIKQTIMSYINQLLIGTDIDWSRIIGFISSDPNYAVIDWAMKREDGNWTKLSVNIGLREYAWIENLNNIVISTTPIEDIPDEDFNS
jgi:uncharacterized phage protein gp47/JayE